MLLKNKCSKRKWNERGRESVRAGGQMFGGK